MINILVQIFAMSLCLKDSFQKIEKYLTIFFLLYWQHMNRKASGLLGLRHASSLKEQKKEDHSSYFQTLEQRLLQESDKLTSLIGTKSLSTTDVRLSKGQQGSWQTKGSLVLNRPNNNRKGLLSSKSQYFQGGKQQVNQLQRKLTYNILKPDDSPVPQRQSPSKSENRFQFLKATTSTTSSAVLIRTIDQIKKMGIRHNSPPQILRKQILKQPTIDDFQLLKYVQQGQFGTVHLSRHKKTNFLCAIKKIPKKIFEGQEKFIGQLARQVKIQSYLDHPNVVQLYAFFCDQDHLYLVLELCCGGNLYNALRSQGRFSEQKVKGIMKQVGHAVQFMHDNDIIHRDIKPENILLHQSIAKVCDFGWSIHSPLLRQTRCGTPLYSSPQVVQRQQYDNKVDIWNIGILAFELIYGRVPFQIRTEDDLVKVVDEDIYFPKSVPVSPVAKHFILCCLKKNPKQRFPMSKLVDHEFLHHHKQNI